MGKKASSIELSNEEREYLEHFRPVPEQFRLKLLQEREFYYYVRMPYQ